MSHCPHDGRILVGLFTVRVERARKRKPQYVTYRYRCARCRAPLPARKVFRRDTDVLVRVVPA